MAKHITKSVLEDIACEIKRIGIITLAFEENRATEEMKLNFGEDFDRGGTATLDWLTSNLEDIFAEHDPTFDVQRFREIAKYKYEY